jgi:hypothetical protein
MYQLICPQAGYLIRSPLTWRGYQDITTEFQFAVKLLMESTRGAIPRENGHFQIPSFVQCHFADMLGRLMAQWSPAPFFMEYAAQKRYQASFIHSYSSPR